MPEAVSQPDATGSPSASPVPQAARDDGSAEGAVHAAEHYRQANILRDQGQFVEAVELYERALVADPGHIWARIGLGEVARRRGDREAALAQFKRALARNPDHDGACFNAAAELAELLRYDEAEALYGRIHETSAFYALAAIGRGRIARARGRREEALSCFRRAAEHAPEHPIALLEIAREQRDQGAIAEAGETIAMVLARDPKNTDALTELGRFERQLGHRAAALEIFRTIAAIDARCAQALVDASIEELALARPADAAHSLKQALAIEPTHLGALLQLAEHAWMRDDFDESLEIAERAAAAHPGSLWPVLHLCRIFGDVGRNSDALDALDAAEARLGPLPEIVARRVELLRSTGQWDAARAALAGIHVNPFNRFWLWFQEVVLHIETGAFDAAEEALRAPVCATRREEAMAAFLRGRLAEARWHLDEASDCYQNAVALLPDEIQAHHELTRVSMLRLDLDRAAIHLGRVAQLRVDVMLLTGRRPNPAQTHVGQLLDEYLLDEAARARLDAIGRMPPDEKISSLKSLMRDHPDHTPAAITLLIALRQQGLLDEALCPETGEPPAAQIPRVICQYWDGPDPPAEIMSLMAGWRERNPDFQYRRFDDPAAQAYLRAHYDGEILRAYRKAPQAAQRADLFRLAFLFAEGGVYVDADDRCIAPLRGLVPPLAGFLAHQEDYGTLGNNLIGASPGHPILGRALHLASQAVLRGDKDIIWLSTGPGLLTRAFAQIFAETPLTPSAFLARTAILERSALRKAVAPHIALRYKKSPVHWLKKSFELRGRRK